MGIGFGDTTFLKKTYVGQNGYRVCDMGMLAKIEYLIGLKQLITKKKKKVDRSETLLWMVVRSSIYFYGLVRESTLHFQMNCEMHWRDMISVGHPSASQFFWVDGF